MIWKKKEKKKEMGTAKFIFKTQPKNIGFFLIFFLPHEVMAWIVESHFYSE